MRPTSGAWTRAGYEIGPGGGNQEDTPLMSNGTLYGITNWSIVFAVDARTGKEKWRWDPEVNHTAVQPKICCGVVNRGLAIYEGNVIAPIIDGRLVAINIETGKPVWEARVAYAQDNYTITMAPRIAKGKVIIGVAARNTRCADTLKRTMPRPASSPGASTPFRAILPSPRRTKICARRRPPGLQRA